MMKSRSSSLLLLAVLLLSACTGLRESSLLAPSRGRPELGVRLRVIAPGPLPARVVGDRPRVLLVVGVKPGRPAARAGVLNGDVLLSLDGQAVSGMANSVALMQHRRWGEEVVLTVLRDGQLQDIPVTLEP